MRRLPAYLLVAGYAILVGTLLRPNVLGDDAAITLRYAERVAQGRGFTYNDHERVLGASNPLYAILVALVARAGTGVETASRALGLVFFTASCVLAAQLAGRLAAPVWGALAGLLLATDGWFRYQSLSGMECGLSVCLGLLVVLCLVDGRQVAAGVFLGLALWNKLDAGLLALAAGAGVLAIERRPPVRVALAALATVLPWLVFSTIYFGSPVPRSLLVKLGHTGFRPAGWVLGFLEPRLLSLLGGAGFFAFAPRLEARERVAAVALGGWFVLHAAAYAVVGLGAPYPWYLAALIPPPIILSCAFAGRVFERAKADRRAAGAWALLVLAAVAGMERVHATYATLGAGNPLTPWEAFEADRRLAGIFIDEHAGPDEVVECAYGWVAFESRRPFNDDVGLNSRALRAPVAYRVEHGYPHDSGFHGPTTPLGFVALATFGLASDLEPGYSWFTVFGRPESRIARSGARYLQYRLFELPRPAAATESGLDRARIAGADLTAPPPSGATFAVANGRQPVRIVFAPEGDPGTTFEVRSGGSSVYRATSRGADAPMKVEIPGAAGADVVSVSFLTSREDGNDGRSAVWRSVKVVVGAGSVDAARTRSNKIIAAWRGHSP